MRGVDEPYQRWQKRPSFTTRGGKRLYPLYAPAYAGQANHVRVFDRDVDPTDTAVEYALLKHRVAFLDWLGVTISVVDTHPDWQEQGIGRRMLGLAKKEEPRLRHAPCAQRSEKGELFVRGTDPDEACRGNCGPGCRDWASQIGMPGGGDSPDSVRPLPLRERFGKFLGL